MSRSPELGTRRDQADDAANAQPAPPLPVVAPSRERVGVIVVHGIGEQRRFEHVDAQVREILRALMARSSHDTPSKVTVEVYHGDAASFQAEQDSWVLDTAPVRATVQDAPTDTTLDINFHEVWWADSNESYSLFKQIRFWGWALVIAFIPMKFESTHAGAALTRLPTAPGGRTTLQRLWVRARLFSVSVIAVIGSASVGLIAFLAKRLLNLEAPDFIKVFVNYVAGVKLYNQKSRLGSGFPATNADFLESIYEPPRVTVRRRMIRAIAQVALEKYDRWYVVAHSLGTVVAFNGLMEASPTWPGYFDEEGWADLVTAGLAGPLPQGLQPQANGTASPRRPVWCRPDHGAYRPAIFDRLHGVLMMGSPLEKFATLWPGRVPISLEPAFRPNTTWISVYDPIDPVSGVLRAFNADRRYCPQPETIGYAADWKLFMSHIRYLKWRKGGGTLADGLAEWLVSGDRSRIAAGNGGRWFPSSQQQAAANGAVPAPDSSRHRARTMGAWTWWIAAAAVLLLLGGICLPPVIGLGRAGLGEARTQVLKAFGRGDLAKTSRRRKEQ